MSLHTPVKFRHCSQSESTFCGPASIQMVLSSLGVPNQSQPSQEELYQSVQRWPGRYSYGSPAGVACTINRFAPNDLNAEPHEYVTRRAAVPYEPCNIIVDALHAYGSASIAMVLNGQHWLVVVGADSREEPKPEQAYDLSGFWISDPSTTVPIQHETYASFLYTYFTGNASYEYEQFVVVTDIRARPTGKLRLPPPEPPPPNTNQPIDPAPFDPVAMAVAGLKRFGLWNRFEGATPGEPRFVQRADHGYDFYYIVPFRQKDQRFNLVRIEANHGTYLGTAFDCPPDFVTDPAVLLPEVDTWIHFGGLAAHVRSALLNTSPTMTWKPCVESRSPYQPFYFIDAGPHSMYVRLDGQRYGDLQEL